MVQKYSKSLIIGLSNIGLIHVTKIHFSPWGVWPLKRVKALKEIECPKKWPNAFKKGLRPPYILLEELDFMAQ